MGFHWSCLHNGHRIAGVAARRSTSQQDLDSLLRTCLLHMQAQWAQAVRHENEKLHQLTDLQKAIVSSLQKGHRTANAAVKRADELASTSQHAKRDSIEASKLHNSLVQHTGHAKVDFPFQLQPHGILCAGRVPISIVSAHASTKRDIMKGKLSRDVIHCLRAE